MNEATHAVGFGSVPWATAISATLHCLTGCAIGEVLGMVIGTSLGLHNAGTVVLSVALAFVFGYALTMRGVLRAGLGFTEWSTNPAGRSAWSTDTPSSSHPNGSILARSQPNATTKTTPRIAGGTKLQRAD